MVFTNRLVNSPPERELGVLIGENDPSADSSTETLLRLILPLSDMAYTTFRARESRSGEFAEALESVGATGGVYKS